MMSDRAVFDVIKILADAMPWHELISFTFEVTLIDISVSVIEFAVSNDAFCNSFIKFYKLSSVIDILLIMIMYFSIMHIVHARDLYIIH